MCYSFVMGIDDSIKELSRFGFTVEADGSNYTVSFPEDKAPIWEEFITVHLEVEYWNEYLSGDQVVFLFHLQDGIKRYVVQGYENPEVLALCEQLCDCKFESLKALLLGNHFYKSVMKE